MIEPVGSGGGDMCVNLKNKGGHYALVFERDVTGDWSDPNVEGHLKSVEWLAPLARLHAAVCNAEPRGHFDSTFCLFVKNGTTSPNGLF
jgi:hypothetical protein